MICANPDCGRELSPTMLVCTSNQQPGATCMARSCPGLRFCSAACVSACWRKHNRFPTISYVIVPALDEDAAADTAQQLIEHARLERLWGQAA